MSDDYGKCVELEEVNLSLISWAALENHPRSLNGNKRGQINAQPAIKIQSGDDLGKKNADNEHNIEPEPEKYRNRKRKSSNTVKREPKKPYYTIDPTDPCNSVSIGSIKKSVRCYNYRENIKQERKQMATRIQELEKQLQEKDELIKKERTEMEALLDAKNEIIEKYRKMMEDRLNTTGQQQQLQDYSMNSLDNPAWLLCSFQQTQDNLPTMLEDQNLHNIGYHPQEPENVETSSQLLQQVIGQVSSEPEFLIYEPLMILTSGDNNSNIDTETTNVEEFFDINGVDQNL